MPDPKKSPLSTATGKGGVTFNKEFIQRTCRTRMEVEPGVDLRVIGQPVCAGGDGAVKGPPLREMVVFQTTVAVRQAEGSRAEPGAQPVRDPLGDEVDAGFVALPDIRSHVEQFMGGNRCKGPGGERSSPARP